MTNVAPRRRFLRWFEIVAVIGVFLLVGANVTGNLPIEGGPVGPVQVREPDDGFELVTVHTSQPLYTTALIENSWPVPITIVSVTARGAVPQPAVTFVGARAFDAFSDDVVLGIQPEIPQAWQAPAPFEGLSVAPRGDAQHRGAAILVRFDPLATGDNGIYDIVVDYSMGPFRFRSSVGSSAGSAILICAPRGRPEDFPDLCPPI